jgi:hypothetical protein
LYVNLFWWVPKCSRMRMYFWHQQDRLNPNHFLKWKPWWFTTKIVSVSPQNPPMLITRIHKESSMCLWVLVAMAPIIYISLHLSFPLGSYWFSTKTW